MATEFALVNLITEKEVKRTKRLSEMIEYIQDNVDDQKDHIVKEYRDGVYLDFSSAFFLAEKFPIPDKAPNGLNNGRYAEYEMDVDTVEPMRGRRGIDEFED